MSSEGMVLGSPAENMAETNVAYAGTHCDECGSDEVHRIFRKGFFQEKIYPLLGFYPWRCKQCGLRLMLRNRGLASGQEVTGRIQAGGNSGTEEASSSLSAGKVSGRLHPRM